MDNNGEKTNHIILEGTMPGNTGIGFGYELGSISVELNSEDLPEEEVTQDAVNLATVKKITEIVKGYYPKSDVSMIMRAYEVADTMHYGQVRQSGEPYIVHPIAVALMLAEMTLDPDCVAAGLLHDVVEDTSMTLEDLQEEFGPIIAALVNRVTKLKRMSDLSKEEENNENLRKMFISIAEDARVVVIKLVDRLHNMRTLQYMNTDKQMQKASETLEIYAPLASRFGMNRIKWELEDLSFKYLDPVGYDEIVNALNSVREEREAFIKQIVGEVDEILQKEYIDAHIDGRPKHIYSIKKKMNAYGITAIGNKDIHDLIYDLLAIRIIVDTVEQCYTVLGIMHNHFSPMPFRFKDYIANPKQNMYQSIHTTVMSRGEKGKPFEIQIRTWKMHEAAETGIASHWRYKENNKERNEYEEKQYEQIREMFEKRDTTQTSEEFVENMKMDLYTDEIFVYTPKGDIKKLPLGSTAVDYAYMIHSDVGNKMIGVRIDGEMKPIDYQLKSGDRVEIITSKSPNRGPSRDWIKMVKTSEARQKLKAWFKKERREENIEIGKNMLEKELKRLGFSFHQMFSDEEIVSAVLEHSNFKTTDDLLSSIGFGDVAPTKVLTRFKNEYDKKYADAETQNPLVALREKAEKQKTVVSEDGIIVKGISNCLVRPAKCCHPVPGDVIVGYTTRAKGVSVHREDCPNVKQMILTDPGRMIPVRWAVQSSKKIMHPADITIEALDDGKTLIMVASIINEMELKMTSINARCLKDDYQLINLVVQITDREELDKLITKIEQLENVSRVTRNSK